MVSIEKTPLYWLVWSPFRVVGKQGAMRYLTVGPYFGQTFPGQR